MLDIRGRVVKEASKIAGCKHQQDKMRAGCNTCAVEEERQGLRSIDVFDLRLYPSWRFLPQYFVDLRSSGYCSWR